MAFHDQYHFMTNAESRFGSVYKHASKPREQDVNINSHENNDIKDTSSISSSITASGSKLLLNFDVSILTCSTDPGVTRTQKIAYEINHCAVDWKNYNQIQISLVWKTTTLARNWNSTHFILWAYDQSCFIMWPDLVKLIAFNQKIL